MAKVIFKRFLTPDHPLFSEGFSTFSVRRRSAKKPSSDDLESGTTESSTSESKGNSKLPATKE